jgi:hypothetical protein
MELAARRRCSEGNCTPGDPMRSALTARCACTFAAAVALVVLVPESASAKGPVAVRITGPGLTNAIVIDADSDQPLFRVLDGSGLWHQLGNLDVDGDQLAGMPAGDLGTKFRLRWSVPYLGATRRDDVFVQYVYVRPGAAALVFTPPGQHAYGGLAAPGGWFRTRPSFSRVLESIGVPIATPTAVTVAPAVVRPTPSATAPAAAGRATLTRSSRTRYLPAVVAAAVLASAGLAAWMLLRRRVAG